MTDLKVLFGNDFDFSLLAILGQHLRAGHDDGLVILSEKVQCQQQRISEFLSWCISDLDSPGPVDAFRRPGPVVLPV